MALMTPDQWDRTPDRDKDQAVVRGLHLRSINDTRRLITSYMADALRAQPDRPVNQLVAFSQHVDDPFTSDEYKEQLRAAPLDELGQKPKFVVSVVGRADFTKLCLEWADHTGNTSYGQNGRAAITWKSPDPDAFIVAVAAYSRMSLWPLKLVTFRMEETPDDILAEVKACVEDPKNAGNDPVALTAWWFEHNCVQLDDGRLLTVTAVPQPGVRVLLGGSE